MARKIKIPVRKVRKVHPQTRKKGWTVAVASHGTIGLDSVTQEASERLMLEPDAVRMVLSAVARVVTRRLSSGMIVDLGLLGHFRPTVRGAGWSETEEGCTLHGCEGYITWMPSKQMRRDFWNAGCDWDWLQRDRNRAKARAKGAAQGDEDDDYGEDITDDDDDFDDPRYPLDLDGKEEV